MINNKKPLKVLMFGNLGSGKTSILAQLLSDRNLKSLASQYGITLEINGQKSKDYVDSSERVMKDFFEPNIPIPSYDNTNSRDIYSKFPINTYPTEEQYEILLSIKNESGKRSLQNISFTDCSGNEFKYEGIHVDKRSKKKCAGITNMVKKADVILFAVDSVDLMENSSYEHDSALMLLNCLKQCYKSNSSMEKMIMFVPVKFEKYFSINVDSLSYDFGRNDEFNQFMSKFYFRHAPLLNWLKNPSFSACFDVSVMPVLTLGNIEFAEYKSNTANTEQNPSDAQSVKIPLYQYNRIIESENDIPANTVPNYAPQFFEYPSSCILAYLINKILMRKLKRISKLSFSDKVLHAVKHGLISTVDNAPEEYPRMIIQSKLFSTVKPSKTDTDTDI